MSDCGNNAPADRDRVQETGDRQREAQRARAFWVERPGVGAIRTHEIAAPGPGEVGVRALASGVSRGTEALVFAGRVPASEYQRMRAPFQEGHFPGPVKYGYASVGRVEAGDVSAHGQRVFCLFPHQDYYVVPREQALPVPDSVPDARAPLAANMETAVNALWDAGPRVGDRIAVVGGGVVGLLCAYLAAQIPGVRLEVVDIDPRRAQVAAALGLTLVLPEVANSDCDLVIHCSGHPKGLDTAISLAGFEAVILELSWYGEGAVAAPLGGAFHSQRLTIRSSQVGTIAQSRRPRWHYRDRLALALRLLDDERLDALITSSGPLDSLPETMRNITKSDSGVLCHIVRYS